VGRIESEFPGSNAQEIYAFLITEPYREWDLWPGTERMYQGRSPHGAYLTTYVNDIARVSIKTENPMFNRAMVVMENYTPGKKLKSRALMYKIKGYNPAADDWYWAEYDENGVVQKAGKVKYCIECHSNMKAKDYIFTENFIK
jgi:hypothetical protein